MAIKFGSPQAQRILHRDKAREKVHPEVWEEIKSLRQENGDYEDEIDDLQERIRSNDRRIYQLLKVNNISIEDEAYFNGIK